MKFQCQIYLSNQHQVHMMHHEVFLNKKGKIKTIKILKTNFYSSSSEQPQRIIISKKPPGPPPGRPPILSDNEDISDDEEGNLII